MQSEIQINNVYLPYLNNTSRYLILYGSSGSGKSVFAAQKVIIRVCSENKHRILVIRKVANTLRSSTYQLILDLLYEYNLRSEFEINKSEMRFTHKGTGNEILMAGLDDVEKLKSIAGITSIWIEEATEVSPGDFDQVDLRLRGETINYKQIMLSFNPININHWLKQRFFDTDFDGTTILKTTFIDNAFIDSEYRTVLENKAKVSPNLYRIYYLGEWGVEDVLAPFLYNFSKDNHSGQTKIIENVPLIFSLDFNVNPFVCTVSQIWKDSTHHIHTHREHVLNNLGVKEMIELIKTNYTPLQLSSAIFTGDATQRKRSVEQSIRGTQHLHAWLMIDEAFRLGKRLKVPTANPSVASSREICNYVLALHPDVTVNESCTLLINEMQMTQANDEGGILKKDRNKEDQRADALDTWRYLIMSFCSDIVGNPKKYGIK